MRWLKPTRRCPRGSAPRCWMTSWASCPSSGSRANAMSIPATSARASTARGLSWRRRSMPAHSSFDYAVIRVVPRVEREEFVNVGVIVSCPVKDFLEARIEIDEPKLRALDPAIDLEVVRMHLASIPLICAGGEKAGPIGKLPARERFRWLIAARSTMIQASPAHSGRCEDPQGLIERLMDTMVRPP